MISLIRESASVIWTSTNMFESFKNNNKKKKITSSSVWLNIPDPMWKQQEM